MTDLMTTYRQLALLREAFGRGGLSAAEEEAVDAAMAVLEERLCASRSTAIEDLKAQAFYLRDRLRETGGEFVPPDIVDAYVDFLERSSGGPDLIGSLQGS